jgi:hypothetical protein
VGIGELLVYPIKPGYLVIEMLAFLPR